MRSSTTILSVAALAGLAAASPAPAPQYLDFAQITAAPAVQSAPAYNGIPVQAATLVSAASASTTATAGAVQRRDLEKRTFDSFFCAWFGTCWSSSSSAAAATSTAKSSSSSSSSSSAYTPYYPALSTATQYTTGTTTISSTSSCPTTPEEGTYCGFINPEDPCAPQPDGYGPVPTPDTVSAFYAYAPFHSMASAAPSTIAAASSTATASSVPQIYKQTFRDLNASSSAQSYISLLTLQSYDSAKCAAACDANSLCTAFNLYIERDPSVNPCKNDSTDPTVWGYYCPNPASMTSYKCTLWGSSLDASTATNAGQWREDFNVVITASNGWDKVNTTAPTCKGTNGNNGSGWSKPTTCGGSAINNPSHWMGSKFYPGPYNAQLCSDFAISQNTLNKAAAIAAKKTSYTPCNMFNAYYLHKNGKPHGTYCALYDSDLSTSYATYNGGLSGKDSYSCKQSYKFALSTPDTGRC